MKRTPILLVLLMPFLLGVLACEREVTPPRSSFKQIEYMAFHFGDLKKQVEFYRNRAVINLPRGTELTAQVEYLVRGKVIVTYNDLELVSSGDVVFEDGKETIFFAVAEDGSFQEFGVTVFVAKEDTKQVTSAKIGGVEATVSKHTIHATLPFDSNISKVPFQFTHNGVTASMESGVNLNFMEEQDLIIEAEDGTKKTYLVFVDVEEFRYSTTIITDVILDFGEDLSLEPAPIATLAKVRPRIDYKTGQIVFEFPYEQSKNLQEILIPYTIILRDGAKVAKEKTIELSFRKTTRVTVVSENGQNTQNYDISFTRDKSNANNLKTLSLEIAGTVYDFIPVEQNMLLTLPINTPITEVVPEFTMSKFSKATITSGVAITDFELEKPREIIITAQNGEKRSYFVTLEYEKSDDNTLKEFRLLNEAGVQIEYTRILPTSIKGKPHVAYLEYELPSDTDLTEDRFKADAILSHPKARLIFKEEEITLQSTFTLRDGTNRFIIVAENGATLDLVVFVRVNQPEITN